MDCRGKRIAEMRIKQKDKEIPRFLKKQRRHYTSEKNKANKTKLYKYINKLKGEISFKLNSNAIFVEN